MVPNYRLLASLFILNIGTSLYARKQAQPTDDNEDKTTEAASSPPALSTGRNFTVDSDKLTKQSDFNKTEDENDITENDDDKIWIISDDNIDEVLSDPSNIRTDETNNYEFTNPEGETKKSPKLADTRKKVEKINKTQRKTQENTTNSTNTMTTVKPEEIEIEENIDNKNPTKSEIHAYNTVKKQASQVSITFSNDGNSDKKSNEVISYKNKDNSAQNIVLQKLLNLLSSNVGIANRYPKKRTETEDENNEETDAVNDTPMQTITAIEKTQSPPSSSKLMEPEIIQNINTNNNNYPVLPRNLLTVINSGSIDNMQAIVPLAGHNLIFNDKTINPGIHIVTTNVTSEEYVESVADMISTLSFERKADIKILGKKAKKKLVQTLIKSVEKGMILIINTGSINGLSLRLPCTDTPTSEESTTKKTTLEVPTEKLDVNITAENLDSKIFENLNLEITTKSETSTAITTANIDTEVTNADPNTELTTLTPETEVTNPNMTTKITAETLNTEIVSTELDTERATIDQNPKSEITSYNPNIEKNATNRLSNKPGGNYNTSKNVSNELTTEHLKPKETSTKSKGDIIYHKPNDESTSSDSDVRNIHPERKVSTHHIKLDNTRKTTIRMATTIFNPHNKTPNSLPESEVRTEYTNFSNTSKTTVTTDLNPGNKSQSNGDIFQEKWLQNLYNYLNKYIFKKSYYSNIKSEILRKKLSSNMTIGNSATATKNYNISRENNDIENTETGYNGTDTSEHKVKRDITSNFPMLGLLEHANDAKKIKNLMSYLQRLLDFAENSGEENASQSFQREFYEDEEDLVPLNTKF